jgi:uncharacterized protein (TIGR02757 family)
LKDIKKFLDDEVRKRDIVEELSLSKPDPLLIAREYKDEKVALVSALFAYGRADQIVKFLKTLNFSKLQGGDLKELEERYYRFQNGKDIIALFSALQKIGSLEEIFYEGYKKESSVLDGLSNLITEIQNISTHSSKGYSFLIGKPPKKISGTSPLKRWNLFLRWMVRKDNLDMGLWEKVSKKDLLIPLDTHTFNISQKLGLLNRKTYDLKSVIELTKKLKEFDPEDPIKYDFAIYRVGQEKLI